MAADQKFEDAQYLARKSALKYEKIIGRWKSQPEKPGYGKIVVKPGRIIHYDSSMPTEMLAAELIHLTHHLVENHQGRREDRDVKLWRVASCLEVVWAWDEDIRRAGLEWAPGTDLRDQIQLPKRMKAEEIYEYLKQLQLDQDPDVGDGDESGDGEEAEEQQGEGKKKGKGQPGQGQPGEGQPGEGQPGEGQPGKGQPGKGEPGQGQPGEGQPGQGDPGDVEDGMCRLEEDDFETLEEMLGEGEGDGDGDGDGDEDGDGDQPGKGKRPGKSPGDKDRELESADTQRVLVIKIMARLMSGRHKDNYSFKRPNPRAPESLLRGGSLPTLRADADRMGVIVDSSGSVDKAMLSIFFDICRDVQRQTPTQPLKVAAGDTKVQVYGDWQYVARHPKGGGGTNMDKVVPEGWKLIGRPNRLLVITDGETPWPKENELAPKTVFLVVNSPNSHYVKNMPPHIRNRAIVVEKQRLLRPPVQRGLE
jgi:predicted metal-dependent peptidase